MSLAILFHFLCTQHVSDIINISIIRSLRLCCWITTSVVLFLVRCVLEIWCGWVWVVSVLQAEALIQQHSRKLLMMGIFMSETCWVHKKWNKTASDIKLVFYPSAIHPLTPSSDQVKNEWSRTATSLTHLLTYEQIWFITQLSILTHAQLQRHRLKFIKNYLKNSYMFRSSTIFRELQCPR